MTEAAPPPPIPPVVPSEATEVEDDTTVAGVAPQTAQPPGAELKGLDPTAANPGTSTGEPATIAIVHDSGATFFHTLGTLPRRFFDEVGNVVLGRHLDVPVEEAEKELAPAQPPTIAIPAQTLKTTAEPTVAPTTTATPVTSTQPTLPQEPPAPATSPASPGGSTLTGTVSGTVTGTVEADPPEGAPV